MYAASYGQGRCVLRLAFGSANVPPTSTAEVVEQLNRFVRDAGEAQYKAWQKHVPALQRECRELSQRDALAPTYTAILEYELPYDLRRTDLIVLERAAVVVAELKGFRGYGQGAIDQLLGYTRDLRAYHAACANRPLIPVLVTTAASRTVSEQSGVIVCHSADFHLVLAKIAEAHPGPPVRADEFVSPRAYVPLPTIVEAARQLFTTHEVDISSARGQPRARRCKRSLI